jgi:hypothetical protein
MKLYGVLLELFLLTVCANASLTEIRKDFFNRTTNLHATAIMSAPTGDASYLVSVYESTTSCTVVPTLRWTDENGVARSQTGIVSSGSNCSLSILANIRVKATTQPTIETGGDVGGFDYSLYVSGLGFWPTGAQHQGGLSEATGTLPKDLVYAVPAYTSVASTNAILVAYSTGFAGSDIPYVSWTDEYNYHSQPVPVGTSAIVPIRVAGGTEVWIHTFPGDSTWYALIIFGAPAKGAGPFTDYEANLLDWSNATYPSWQTLLTASAAGSNVLLLSDVTQPENDGTAAVSLQVDWANQTTVPCAAALTAAPSGNPASCASAAFIGSNSPLQFRTYNPIGSPWGPSPNYSAEVDVLQF